MATNVEREQHEQDPEWPEQKVSCKECFREIPKTEAYVSEAQDYVLFFCGIACYADWRKSAEKSE